MIHTVKDRFLKYVQIDTQADPYSSSTPSTIKQLDLSRVLSQELTDMDIDHTMTEHGYIYAHIPGNITDRKVASLFFCSHIDTAPDCSGTNVKPIVHTNYQGEDIVLPDDPTQVISTDGFPELRDKIGHDIITASGLTLLGADDKSGVACIMDLAFQLRHAKDIKHGDVHILFTTDEEIGKGVQHVDLDRIPADYGFTLDSGDVGHFEYENFSADAAILTITGVSSHPGYAKGKMEHAAKIASRILSKLPTDTLSPESTSGMEGFVHPNKIEGHLEKAVIEFIIRDFDTSKLAEHAAVIEETAKQVLRDYPNSTYHLEVTEQYRNMRDIIDKVPHVKQIVVDAMSEVGISPVIGAIRGGTDGAILSHRGLPCPNIFSGQHGIHSRQEWTTVQDMEDAVKTCQQIVKLAATGRYQ